MTYDVHTANKIWVWLLNEWTKKQKIYKTILCLLCHGKWHETTVYIAIVVLPTIMTYLHSMQVQIVWNEVEHWRINLLLCLPL